MSPTTIQDNERRIAQLHIRTPLGVGTSPSAIRAISAGEDVSIAQAEELRTYLLDQRSQWEQELGNAESSVTAAQTYMDGARTSLDNARAQLRTVEDYLLKKHDERQQNIPDDYEVGTILLLTVEDVDDHESVVFTKVKENKGGNKCWSVTEGGPFSWREVLDEIAYIQDDNKGVQIWRITELEEEVFE